MQRARQRVDESSAQLAGLVGEVEVEVEGEERVANLNVSF